MDIKILEMNQGKALFLQKVHKAHLPESLRTWHQKSVTMNPKLNHGSVSIADVLIGKNRI